MHVAGDFDELLERHVVSWRHLWERAHIEVGADGRARSDAAPSALPPDADGVEQLGRPRRRRAGPGAARRGLPRSRVLGRGVHDPVAQPAVPPAGARALALPLSAHGPGPPRCDRGRIRRSDVPVAEREQRARGDPDDAPQPGIGSLACRRLAPTAARQRRDRLRRVAVLPRQRRPRVPTLLRGGDDPRDRPLLGQHRHLQPRARPLRDQGCDGPRRVPRGVPRPCRARRRQQRVHEPHGGVVSVPRLRCARAAATGVDAGPHRAAGHHRSGTRAVGRGEPQDARVLPRGERDQPVRGLRAARGARLGRVPAQVRGHPAARPHPRGRRATRRTATS